MIYLAQRLIVNTYGWTRPSPGRLGLAAEGEYVRRTGFGHEDWNFNYDLAIDDNIYGYLYYRPDKRQQDETFQIAFTTYQGSAWNLVGFYLDAKFVQSSSPVDKAVLAQKAKDLLELKKQNGLGRPWSTSTEKAIISKLEEDTQDLTWKVPISGVVRLPQSIPIPKGIYNSKNYRLVRPTFIDDPTFQALRRLAAESVQVEDDEAGFPEGREIYLQHRSRERNPAIVALAKQRFEQKHGKLICQACGFDFEREYGAVGKGFIEAHHVVAVSELPKSARTKVEDIALLCSNCHRMVHRRRPWLKIEQLTEIRVKKTPGAVGR